VYLKGTEMNNTRSKLYLLALCVGLAAPTFGGTTEFTFHIDGKLALLSPAPLINFQVTGTGTSSAGAIVAYSDSGTIDLNNPFPDKTYPLVGNLTMTLANGDTIRASLLEHFVAPDSDGNVSGTEVFTITGGTGMFAGATGVLNGFATGSTNSGTVQFGGAGSVSGPNIISPPCGAANLSGVYMFQLSGSVQTQSSPLAFGPYVDNGLFTADGNGNLTVHDSGNSAGSVFLKRTFPIAYVINNDCTGTFTWPGAGMDVQVSKDGNTINMVFTAPSAVVASGSGKRQ
jgi:hypothetical protein